MSGQTKREQAREALAEVKARCEAATDGPWYVNFARGGEYGDVVLSARRNGDWPIFRISPRCPSPYDGQNLSFTINAPTDLPLFVEAFEEGERMMEWEKETKEMLEGVIRGQEEAIAALEESLAAMKATLDGRKTHEHTHTVGNEDDLRGDCGPGGAV